MDSSQTAFALPAARRGTTAARQLCRRIHPSTGGGAERTPLRAIFAFLQLLTLFRNRTMLRHQEFTLRDRPLLI
jgi:hypothetical protein